MCKREETIKDFAERLRYDIVNRVDADHEVVIQETVVNNGIERVGLVIRKKDACAFEMHPIIYLEELFEMYCDGMPYERVLEKFENINTDAQKLEGCNVSWIKDFESVKERICFKLINANSNYSLLCRSPHRKFLDMAVVYYVFLEVNEGGFLSAQVNDYLLEAWDKTELDLWELAYANTCKVNPLNFSSLKEKLTEILGDFSSNHAERSYVLSSGYGTFGTVHVLYESELGRIAEEIGDDLYFLPTSIHEWFIVPASEMESAKEMLEMASEYFASGLVEEEVELSRSVYCYDRNKGFYKISE